jgi:putative ABC transport system substrate-binding protein
MDQARAVVTAQIQRKPAVIFGNMGLALIAKGITTTVPIVFGTVDDPVIAGAVSSYSRPGANVTGVRFRAGDENTKLLQLLHELVPAATVIGVLVYRDAVAADSDIYAIQTAASSMGVKTIVSRVSDDSEFGAAFAGFADAKVGAVLSTATDISTPA